MSDLFFAFPKTGENCKHKTVGFLEAFSGAGIIKSQAMYIAFASAVVSVSLWLVTLTQIGH